MGPYTDNINFNPFPGLRAYTTNESDWFFGRDVEMEEIHAKLLSNRFVTLIGSAGCGKTSLINCGVIPLVKHHHIYGEAEWRVICFRPGNDPIGNLALALSEELAAAGQPGTDSKTIAAELFDNPNGIAAVLRRFISNPQEKVLLVIDQFEELFSLALRGKKDIVAASVAKFVSLMVDVINQTDENIYSIISLRSDFIGDCSRYHGLTQLINNSNYLVPELNSDNYRRVIEGPVVNAGAKIEPKLVTAILCDIGSRPEQLPVLQHLMMRLWAYWRSLDETGRALNLSDYEAVGKLGKAMEDHADEIYEDLNPRERRICEVMFKSITERGSDNRGLRNPTLAGTIRYVAACSPEELAAVADRFRSMGACFVSPCMPVALTDDTVIDITQEILIRMWDKLRVWVDEEAASARMYLRLSDASAMYQQGKAGLWKTPDLQLAMTWRDQWKPTLAWAERYNPAFERAMVFLRTSEKRFIEEEANKLRLQRERVRKIRIIASGLGLIALFAIAYTFHNIQHRVSADRIARYAETRFIQAIIDKEKADSASTAIREQKEYADSVALVQSRRADKAYNMIDEAVTLAQRSDEKRLKAEEEAANAIVLQNKALQESDSAIRVAQLTGENLERVTIEKHEAERKRMVSVGKAVAVKSVLLQGQSELQSLLAYQAYIFNKRNNGQPNDADIFAGLYNSARQNGSGQLKSFEGHNGDVRSIAFIPGTNEFFTSGSDGKVLKWSLNGNEKAFQVVYSGGDQINVLAVSPDARWLACGSADASIRMIPLNGAEKGFDMKGHKGELRSLVFSIDSRQLYSAALDGRVLKWEISARSYTDVTTGTTQITSIDISSNGSYLAGIRSDGTAVVWDPVKISDSFSIATRGKKINVLKFNPDKNTLALGDIDGNIEIWDIVKQKKISEIKAHNGAVNDIRFSAGTGQMATAGADRVLRIYDVRDPSDPGEAPVTFTDNDGMLFVIEFSPDSRAVIAGMSKGPRNLFSRPAQADLLATEVCNFVSRNMEQAEWNMYIGKDIAYERTCQGKSHNIKIEPIR